MVDEFDCWFYAQGSVRRCTTDELDQGLTDLSTPEPSGVLLFATAYTQGDETLVLFDDYDYDDPDDYIDGYRSEIRKTEGSWHEVSRQRVY